MAAYSVGTASWGDEPCEECRQARRDYDNSRNRRLGVQPQKKAECGTYGGYRAHKKRGEEPCEECRAAKRESLRIYRRRKGQPPFVPPKCGTRGGYRRHKRLGEEPCEECRMAVLAHTEAMRRKKGQKPFRPAVCGTLGGYGRHARNGEEPCEDCKEAKSADSRERKKPRRYWQALWLGQFGVCPLCGRPIPYESSEVHVDHIVPASKGGANDMVEPSSDSQALQPRQEQPDRPVGKSQAEKTAAEPTRALLRPSTPPIEDPVPVNTSRGRPGCTPGLGMSVPDPTLARSAELSSHPGWVCQCTDPTLARSAELSSHPGWVCQCTDPTLARSAELSSHPGWVCQCTDPTLARSAELSSHPGWVCQCLIYPGQVG